MPTTVKYLWTGIPSANAGYATVKLNGAASKVRMVASTNPDMGSPVMGPEVMPDATFKVAKLSISDLTPNTMYYYGVQIDGILDKVSLGQFKTDSILQVTSSALSHRVGFSACFDKVEGVGPWAAMLSLSKQMDFFIHMGDFHYGNVWGRNKDLTTEAHYHAQYDAIFADPNRHKFFRSIPQAYTWDDHDFGGNNLCGRNAQNLKLKVSDIALAAMQRLNPNNPVALTESDGKSAFYHSFVKGRVRYIASDLRSHKMVKGVTDSSKKTMMGLAQKMWWKQEIVAAKNSGQVVCWVSSVPWYAPKVAGEDDWGGYSVERTELANHIAACGMGGKVIVLSGDMHSAAVKDTVNYATNGNGSTVCLHAAPLANNGSKKGGPAWTKIFPGETTAAHFQYGILDVMDDGSTLKMHFQALNRDGKVVVEHIFVPITV